MRFHPLARNYQEEFPPDEWAGPFDLFVPSLCKRVRLFGKAGGYERTQEQFLQWLETEEAQSGKTLLEKAEDAPVAFQILVDILQVRLEREFPDVLLLPRWSSFQELATIAGCLALALRLHFDVSENERTALESAMRRVLAKRFAGSEKLYESCYRFVTESLVDIPRSERGKRFFVLVAMWVYAMVSEGRKIEEEDSTVGRLAEVYQNETIGFWGQDG